MNTEEVKGASVLSKEDRTETMILMQTFEKIPDRTGKKIALAYLEGFAAASSHSTRKKSIKDED